MKRADIRDLPFRHNVKPSLGFEMFRLSQLYDRADRKALDHALETPQRPEFHTLYLGIRGRGRIVVDFTEVPLDPNTVTIVARRRVQHFVPDRAVDAWMLLITPELISLGTDVDPLRDAHVLSPAWAVPAVTIERADRKELTLVIDQLAAEQARPLDTIQPALIASLVRTLLLRVERLAGGVAGNNRAPALTRFFTILERDCLRTRSVAHYARAAGVSARRLGELLVETTGRSTKQVIDDRVALELKRLLVHTDVSVKELAAATGFDEPTNLVKFFRHHVGKTPLEFRADSMFLPSSRRS